LEIENEKKQLAQIMKLSNNFKEKQKETEEVCNETPIKAVKDHIRIEEGDSEKKKLKENLFVLIPQAVGILKKKHGNLKKS